MEKNTVSMEVCEERHKALEKYLNNERSQVEKHDTEIKDIQEAIIRLTALMEKHDQDIEDHEERIRNIEGRPGKRWDSLISQLISIFTAAAAGGIIGHSF